MGVLLLFLLMGFVVGWGVLIFVGQQQLMCLLEKGNDIVGLGFDGRQIGVHEVMVLGVEGNGQMRVGM